MTKTITQADFFQDFYKITADKRIPFKAVFELAHQCNLHCCHCYIPGCASREPKTTKQKELSSQEICSILDQLSDMGCFQLNLTGGEIFTLPDILKIIGYSKKKGFYTSLLSNGTLITPEVADQLKDLGVNQVDITVYGITEKSYERITRVPGSFRGCLRGIQLLRERDIPVCLKMTVITLNKNEFSEIKAFAKELGVRFQWGYFISPKINGSKEPLTFRCSPRDGINLESKNQPNLFEEEKRYRKKNNTSSGNGDFFQCDAGKNSLAITPYGEMILCLDYRLPKYDLRKGTVAEGWKKLVNYVESAKPTAVYQCGECELKEYCQWCPAEGLLNEGDRNACVPYFKELAEIRKERTAG